MGPMCLLLPATLVSNNRRWGWETPAKHLLWRSYQVSRQGALIAPVLCCGVEVKARLGWDRNQNGLTSVFFHSPEPCPQLSGSFPLFQVKPSDFCPLAEICDVWGYSTPNSQTSHSPHSSDQSPLTFSASPGIHHPLLQMKKCSYT